MKVNACSNPTMADIPSNLGRRIGDTADLPPELLDQLQLMKVGELDQVVIDVLRDDLEGIANLDEILVAVYRKSGEIQKRQYLSNKLYRMSKMELIESVKGKKGVYRSKD